MAILHVMGNPQARSRTRDALGETARALRRQGHDVVELDVTSVERALESLRTAVDGGAERVVLVGGDGLVHLAVQGLAGGGTSMGVVPAGTGNDFARALGIPTDDLDGAIALATGEAVGIDAIRSDRCWVASVATIGFSVEVNARADRLRWPRGSGRYTIATFLELPHLAPSAVVLEVDGVRHELEVTLLAVSNTSFFGGGMRISPGALADDGVLDVTAIGPVGRIELLRVFPRVFKGTHVDHPAVTTLRGSTVRITGDGETWGDGEPVGELPATFEAVPGALSVAGAALTRPEPSNRRGRS